MTNDINFKLIEAERAATKLINEFGICSPEHIRIRDIAYAKGALVVENHVPGAAASMAKLGNKATIRISGGDQPERQRFSIAHELGHLLMNHLTSIHKACSDEDMFNWYQSSQETQANFFASELMLPTSLVTKRCDVATVNFDPIQSIATDFRASLTATAIKFVMLCPEQCAVVFSKNGKIKWFYKSPTWWPYIKREQQLDTRTLAYDFFAGDKMEPDPQEVDADAWIESRGIDEVFEHSIASPTFGFVLTILWIKPY